MFLFALDAKKNEKDIMSLASWVASPLESGCEAEKASLSGTSQKTSFDTAIDLQAGSARFMIAGANRAVRGRAADMMQ